MDVIPTSCLRPFCDSCAFLWLANMTDLPPQFIRPRTDLSDADVNKICDVIREAGFGLHKFLGPGFREESLRTRHHPSTSESGPTGQNATIRHDSR